MTQRNTFVDSNMDNPYEPSRLSLERKESQQANRLLQTLAFCAVAYLSHALALWGIACFHDAHIGSVLREPFQSISQEFGAMGLFGVALVYALAPALGYFVCLMLFSRWLESERAWSMAMNTAVFSLGATLAADGILGLPLFTTG